MSDTVLVVAAVAISAASIAVSIRSIVSCRRMRRRMEVVLEIDGAQIADLRRSSQAVIQEIRSMKQAAPRGLR